MVRRSEGRVCAVACAAGRKQRGAVGGRDGACFPRVYFRVMIGAARNTAVSDVPYHMATRSHEQSLPADALPTPRARTVRRTVYRRAPVTGA